MTEGHRALLIWLGLTAASSPALVSLALKIQAEPTHRYTLFVWLLLGILLLRRSPDPEPPHPPHSSHSRRPRLGWSLLALGFMAQLLGAASSSGFIAQCGIPVSILGVGLILGRPGLATLLLTFGLVPVPVFVFAIGSPGIESRIADATSGLFALLGWPIAAGGPLLQFEGRRFELFTSDAGLLTAICFAELAWFRGMREGLHLGEICVRGLRAGLLGFAAQPLLIALCVVTLPLGFPEVGRFLLSHGVPIALAAVVIAGEARGDRT